MLFDTMIMLLANGLLMILLQAVVSVLTGQAAA